MDEKHKCIICKRKAKYKHKFGGTINGKDYDLKFSLCKGCEKDWNEGELTPGDIYVELNSKLQ